MCNNNCTSCVYQDSKTCMWFEENKSIPSKVYKVGCKLYIKDNKHPLMKNIIKIFNGRIIQ